MGITLKSVIKKSLSIYFVGPFFKVFNGSKSMSRSQQCSSRYELSPTRNRRVIPSSNSRKFVTEEDSAVLAKQLAIDCISSTINKYSFEKQYVNVFTTCLLEYTKEIECKLRIPS